MGETRLPEGSLGKAELGETSQSLAGLCLEDSLLQHKIEPHGAPSQGCGREKLKGLGVGWRKAHEGGAEEKARTSRRNLAPGVGRAAAGLGEKVRPVVDARVCSRGKHSEESEENTPNFTRTEDGKAAEGRLPMCTLHSTVLFEICMICCNFIL